MVEDFTEVDNKSECASIKNKEHRTRDRIPEETEMTVDKTELASKP
ncbi:MAG: hypothetical protein KKD78_03130 [Proteobacteria bacterium]|nr:hypothetical protein [Pseudomonadota bacterium]MBU4394013.1 hypothetical protein [Pseudomonadota bacterium]